MLRDTILALDEGPALAVLSTFAAAQKRPGKPAPEWDSGMATAISEALGVAAAQGVTDEEAYVSRGEIAKQALFVLAEDDDHAASIKILAASAQPDAYSPMEGMALVTALLVVLQTQLDFERLENGQWTATLRRPSEESITLRTMGSKFLAYMDQ